MPLKNGVVLREYQIEGVNWLLFSWYPAPQLHPG